MSTKIFVKELELADTAKCVLKPMMNRI